MGVGKLDKVIFCDFCGKHQHEVETIIAGPSVFICDECVEICMGILLSKRHPKNITVTGDAPTPTEQEKA